MNELQLERGDEVTCRLVGGHKPFLSRGKRYTVLMLDEQLKRLFVEADDGQKRWFEIGLFDLSGGQVVTLASIRLDDEIDDPRNDVVGVTVTLSDGSERSCLFATPAWIQDHLQLHTEPKVKQRGALRLGQITLLAEWIQDGQGRPFAVINTPNLLIVSRISPDIITKALQHLDDQGVLEHSTLPCSAFGSDEPMPR